MSSALATWGALFLGGCTPEIGDKCVLSTDCSVRGDRLCDTAQPGGYCTQFNCRANLCADEASCLMFGGAIPGCGYDDRAGRGGARTGRSSCAKKCESNDDCRTEEGYVCADPRQPPWNAQILDDDQNKRSCVLAASPSFDAGPPAPEPPVCSPVGPDAGAFDASAPVRDAGAGDAGADGGDAGADGGDGGDAG